MSTTSPLLRLTLQDLDENPDTWGQVLNVSALQLLEDGVASTASISLVSTADYTLSDNDGATSEARAMILGVGGTSGGTTNVIVPTRSKVYIASNTSGSDIVVKTVAGTGPTIPTGEAQWVFCDGTNVLAASAATATSSGTAATATNALSLVGIAGAEYAQKNVAQTYQAGQVVAREPLLNVMGDVTVDIDQSNAFYHLTTAGFNLAAPLNPVNGAQFSLIVEQGTGAPHAITYQANTFLFAGGVAPTLSTSFAQIDYLAFEYVSNLDDIGGGRWIGSIIKGLA